VRHPSAWGGGGSKSLSRDHPSDPPGASLREPHFEKILGWSPWPRSPQDARSPVLTHAPRGHPVAPPLPARTAVDTATEAETCLFRPSRSNPNHQRCSQIYAAQNYCSDTQQLLPSPPYTPSGRTENPSSMGSNPTEGTTEGTEKTQVRVLIGQNGLTRKLRIVRGTYALTANLHPQPAITPH
jgi:hypothetical protein